MEKTPPEARGLGWMRQLIAFGLLAYLASFFFLDSSHQRTLFYLLVAAPSLILVLDFRSLVQNSRKPLLLILSFLAYFSLSSLWSYDGELLRSLKLALSIICLMLCVHSTMNQRADSATLVRWFILGVGGFAACLYCLIAISKGITGTGPSTMLSTRSSLSTLVGWGYGNPINTAIVFGLVILAAWWNFPHSRLLTKFGLFLVIGACTGVMFLTQSRGPFLSVVVVLFLISAYRRQAGDLILAGLVLSTGIVVITYFDLLPAIVNRANSPNHRAGIWLHAIELIRSNLFFGQGLGASADIPILIENSNVVTVSHSHSSVLETFRVGGLVGGLLFFAMIVSAVHYSLTKCKECHFFVFWLVFGLLCLMTNGRLPLIRPSIEWFAFWIPLFLVLFSPSNGNGTTSSGEAARPAM